MVSKMKFKSPSSLNEIIIASSLILTVLASLATSSLSSHLFPINENAPKTSYSVSSSVVQSVPAQTNRDQTVAAAAAAAAVSQFKSEDAIPQVSTVASTFESSGARWPSQYHISLYPLQQAKIPHQQSVLSTNSKILDRSDANYNQFSIPTHVYNSAWNLTPPSPVAFHIAQSNLQLQRDAASVNGGDAKARSYDGATSEIRIVDKLRPKCRPSRSLGSVLKSAKNLLTDGFASLEQRATTGNILFGSGLLAAAIPLAALLIPDGSSNKRNAGLLGSLIGGHSDLQGRVESVMGWVERSIEHLPNFPRLHPQECVKRSICEAHNDPNKYGAVGFMLRLLFPANNSSSSDGMDNTEYKVINKYKHAASFGFNKRLDENGTSSAVCKDKYEDCLVSLLDVAQNLIDLFLK